MAIFCVHGYGFWCNMFLTGRIFLWSVSSHVPLPYFLNFLYFLFRQFCSHYLGTKLPQNCDTVRSDLVQFMSTKRAPKVNVCCVASNSTGYIRTAEGAFILLKRMDTLSLNPPCSAPDWLALLIDFSWHKLWTHTAAQVTSSGIEL